MIDALLEYSPILLRNLLIIYAIILVLAMIRYGLEKTIFIEHFFYTLGMFILSGCMGLQFGSWALENVKDNYIAPEVLGMAWGSCLLIYSLIITLIFILRCLFTKTAYIQVNQKTDEIEIIASHLWATVNGTYWWGILMFWIGLVTFFITKGQVKNVVLSKILGIFWIIVIFAVPFTFIAFYTRWIQKLINIGPIKRRIIKVQNGSILDIKED